MAQQIINVGTNPNDGTGDTLRGAFVKTDDNFTDLYTNKQNTLISGTNIKTINSTSLLGSGNVSVQATLVSGTNIKTINGNSLLGSGDLTISGGITGSGTDNYIPRFNGTTALENSIIFDNGTNVGIGTSSPSETLHVNGNLKIADGSTTKLHITDTILNGIIGGHGFMIDNTSTQFGINVGGGSFFGIKADSDVYFQNIAGEYFGLKSDESQLICYSSLMNAASPTDPSTITNWIQVKDENGYKFYLPIYQ